MYICMIGAVRVVVERAGEERVQQLAAERNGPAENICD